MAGKVFLSYRREDSKGEALALRERLANLLPRTEIFMDVDGGINAGENFVRVLDQRVAAADIFICLIGSRWTSSADAAGKRRLDNPNDFVRIEIASALKREIPIVPVLLDDAPMPSELELPEEIRLLVFKQAMRLRHERFNADVAGIGAAIRTLLAGPRRALSYSSIGLASATALVLGLALGPTVQKELGLLPDRTEATLELQARLKGESEARAEAQSKLAEAEKQARAQAERRSSLDTELSRTKERVATLLKELEKAKSEAAAQGARGAAMEKQIASLFKRRSEFLTDAAYGAYVESILKPGQRVRLLVGKWRPRGLLDAPDLLLSGPILPEGAVGTFVRRRIDNPPAVVDWSLALDFTYCASATELFSRSHGCVQFYEIEPIPY